MLGAPIGRRVSGVARWLAASALVGTLVLTARCGGDTAGREQARRLGSRGVRPSSVPRETGTRFAARIASRDEDAREAGILAAATEENMPAFTRPTYPVPVEAGGHRGVFYVAPDYIGVGVEADWLRTPVRAATAQRIADRFGALLPTRRMVDLIEAAATVHLPFVPLRPMGGAGRSSTELYVVHHSAIERLRGGRVGLVAGHKKDVVVGECVHHHPGHVVIYGGWYRDGARVQPLSAVHDVRYVDYSHGVRLIAPVMLLDGVRRRVADVLADPALSALLSDEGPVARARY